MNIITPNAPVIILYLNGPKSMIAEKFMKIIIRGGTPYLEVNRGNCISFCDIVFLKILFLTEYKVTFYFLVGF